MRDERRTLLSSLIPSPGFGSTLIRAAGKIQRDDVSSIRGAFAMLTILGRPQRVCTGLTRRALLQAGGAGLLGLGLPKVWAAEAARPPQRRRAKSVIFLYLFGGPSQLETFDMKPDAPSGIRGPFRPTASRTPGLLVCEHLPRLAALSDRFSVLRTVTHRHN